MSRTLRLFMAFYSVGMIAAAVACYVRNPGDGLWAIIGSTAACYFVMAVGYGLSNKRETAPAWPWLAVIFASALSLPPAMVLLDDPLTAHSLKAGGILTASVVAYLALTALLLRWLRPGEPAAANRLRRVLPIGLLLAGAALTLSSLFLKVADLEATGWKVITREGHWITWGINVGSGLGGPGTDWLSSVYRPGGYAVYVLALTATIAIVVLLGAARFSVKRLSGSRFVVWPVLALCWTALWVVTDIFWGWHFDLSGIRWGAIAATGLWFAAPIFGVVLLLPMAWKPEEAWRLRAFLVFQVPVVGFNLTMLSAYFGPQSLLNIPGLGSLIVGLQLECWACVELLARRGRSVSQIKQMPPVMMGTAA